MESHPDEVEVVVEIPRGGVVKRRADGGVDFVSPVPCPWNYGSVPAIAGGDGDPLDAIVLGPRLGRGERVTMPVRAVVRFVDAGQPDDKLVVGVRQVGPGERMTLHGFFRTYVLFKRVLNRLRGLSGTTRYDGLSITG